MIRIVSIGSLACLVLGFILMVYGPVLTWGGLEPGVAELHTLDCDSSVSTLPGVDTLCIDDDFFEDHWIVYYREFNDAYGVFIETLRYDCGDVEPCIPERKVDTVGNAMWTLSVVEKQPTLLYIPGKEDLSLVRHEDTILSHAPILDGDNSEAFWEWQPEGKIIKYWIAVVTETTTVYVPVSQRGER